MRKTTKAYHVTAKTNLDGIMVEGLRPLAKNRPKELKVADSVFDIAARRLGVQHRRIGLFAWPNTEPAITDQSAIIEVDINAIIARVFHQAWIDLAWGMIEGIFARLLPGPMRNIESLIEHDIEKLFKEIKNIQVYEGFIGDVLLELAMLYWGTGIRLIDYNKETAQALNQKVIEQQKRFQGLMPGLGHEVALGVEIIKPDRIRIVE